MMRPNDLPTSLTIEQIAELADVSRSTVSRVLNNHPRVRAEVRHRVLQVIRTHNYVPHAAARSLAGSGSHVIGMLIPREVAALFHDPFFAQLLHGIAETCANRGYFLMILINGERAVEEESFGAMLRAKRFDGVLMLSSDIAEPLLPDLIRHRVPLVLIGRHPYADNLAWVDAENRSGARRAVQHLIKLGHRRIAMITGPDHLVVSIDRRDGYRQALLEAGLPIDAKLMIGDDFSQDNGLQSAKQLLDLPQPPTAIFAASDAIAIGALRGIREYGLSVPNDIALIGFDDLPIAAFAEPPLTTIRQPIAEMSNAAADLLINQLQRPGQASGQVCLPTELIIRQSCGAQPTAQAERG